jgi:hypothetical protein
VVSVQEIKYDLHKDALKFKIGNTPCIIGNQQFPVSSKNNMMIWNQYNTEEIERNEKLKQGIDQLHQKVGLRSGHCYSNAGYIVQLGEVLNINIQLVSGWMFSSARPIHHAWNIIDGKYILDVSMDEHLIKLQDIVVEENGVFSKEAYAKKVIEYNKNRKVSETCLWGKINNNLTYIGSIDTEELARKRFHDMMKKFPNHPAYKGFIDENNMTETQRIMKDLQNKKS